MNYMIARKKKELSVVGMIVVKQRKLWTMKIGIVTCGELGHETRERREEQVAVIRNKGNKLIFADSAT